MNKKLEAAAKESAKHYFLNVANTTKHRTDDGLSFRDDYVPSITATWNTYDYAFKSGASYGRKEALMEAIEICDNNLGKYPVDIFRPLRSNEENVSIDRISAQMARHILILIRKELEQLLSKE